MEEPKEKEFKIFLAILIGSHMIGKIIAWCYVTDTIFAVVVLTIIVLLAIGCLGITVKKVMDMWEDDEE